jgi:mRNA interferase RelE/StbE
MTEIKVIQMPKFKRAYKRLYQNQCIAVSDAIKAISKDPHLGQAKKGDLAGLYVYKFSGVNQQFLLAYEFDATTRILRNVGVHENFYRNLKKNN